MEIFRAAWALFQAEPRAGKPVRLIALGISGWEAADAGVQQDLFDTNEPEPHPEQARLDETLDAIRDKFGRGTIRRGLKRRS